MFRGPVVAALWSQQKDNRKIVMIVFSFSLYGASPKYTHGTLANARIIKERFPEALMYVYTAESVPTDIRDQLTAMPHVRVIPVPTREGSKGMFDRFLAIDASECDVMFIRDADSRIHDRDAACIEDFLADPSKMIQIVRDHKYHTSRIMGGIFGIRKEALAGVTMASLIAASRFYGTDYGCDQQFLQAEFYTHRFLEKAQIYDRYGRFESAAALTPFRIPIVDNLFVGQVHEFREDGAEYTFFDAYR
jgi:hypothetical protein